MNRTMLCIYELLCSLCTPRLRFKVCALPALERRPQGDRKMPARSWLLAVTDRSITTTTPRAKKKLRAHQMTTATLERIEHRQDVPVGAHPCVCNRFFQRVHQVGFVPVYVHGHGGVSFFTALCTRAKVPEPNTSESVYS